MESFGDEEEEEGTKKIKEESIISKSNDKKFEQQQPPSWITYLPTFEAKNKQEDDINKINKISFLLSLFDNIVGPKTIHYWMTKDNENDDQNENKSNETTDIGEEDIGVNIQFIKYVAMHTLNGELYQMKLKDQLKFRLYVISEIDAAIFSIFFDAATINPPVYSGTGRSGSTKDVLTSLNCFSMIVPLDSKDIILSNYDKNKTFLVNLFENMIIEYKVYAHIYPKVNI
jgi:hypothetical protein